MKPLIGILALQGAFEEHQHLLKKLGCNSVLIKQSRDLNAISAIIIPGGEST